MGEGVFATRLTLPEIQVTPSPIIICGNIELPSPARGEGTITKRGNDDCVFEPRPLTPTACYFLSPAASAAAVHLTVSRAMNCANSSGGPPIGSNACARSLAATSLAASASLAAALSLSMIGRGVPAGATRPNQTPASKSGSPASTIVGTFGATCARLTELTAKALSLPESICGSIVEATPSISDTRPARRSVTAGGLPWYGTCTSLICERTANTSVERCGTVPIPTDA